MSSSVLLPIPLEPAKIACCGSATSSWEKQRYEVAPIRDSICAFLSPLLRLGQLARFFRQRSNSLAWHWCRCRFSFEGSAR